MTKIKRNICDNCGGYSNNLRREGSIFWCEKCRTQLKIDCKSWKDLEDEAEIEALRNGGT